MNNIIKNHTSIKEKIKLDIDNLKKNNIIIVDDTFKL